MMISVITVCQNSEEFVEHCLQSVSVQDFDDFEHIVIDGGSTDATVDIVRCYESGLSYWHSKPDRGIAHAFNQGLEHSTGKWLIFLNSDDFFVDATVLSRIADQLYGRKDADVVFGRIELVTREQNPKTLMLLGRPWKWNEFRRRDTILHPAAFTNRRFFDKYGGFSEEWSMAVDYEHYLRAGEALAAAFVPILVSRMRTDGVSRTQVSKILCEIKLIQQRHEVWPMAWVAEILYLVYMVRGYASRLAKRIFAER